ncbi:MAG: hypothetical protein Q9222_006428 [Ikaeria aurantiellina]
MPSDTDSKLSSAASVSWPEDPSGTQVLQQEEIDAEFARIVAVDFGLRNRPSQDRSPHVPPQQRRARKEKQRKRRANRTTQNKRSGAQPQEAAAVSGSGTHEDGISLILRAATLLERNEIPCSMPDCPVTQPHGEGYYRHPEEVPDSALANAAFAPSIPPPSVVRAFNNLTTLPSFDDIRLKQKFFDYHTLPCRPSKHLHKLSTTTQCTSRNCGVNVHPHHEGLYLHDGLDASLSLARYVHYVFGISNPPADIWAAAIKKENGDASEREIELVDDFSAHHVVFEDGAMRGDGFKAWQEARKAQRP